MFDFIIKKFFSSNPNKYKSSLPELALSNELQTGLDKVYLQFITDMYLASAKHLPILSPEQQIWFLEEIALRLHLVYPGKKKEECQQYLQNIITKFDLAMREQKEKL